ncbi:uncharacterized protein [Procambarus clarkii]|uniref:uncharacterized protein n=1 Tax=Procambarus clarkii TaxID=6728 RepID=UPI001E677639|nr:uncharacterized protein LOC123775085 [Procambarus clarkii]XP_045625891.1 uncharacterized protein LOC123775085 [Procambarus clarkii]
MEFSDSETILNFLEQNSQISSEDVLVNAEAGMVCNSLNLKVEDDDDNRLETSETLLDNLIFSVCSEQVPTSTNNAENSSKITEAKYDTKKAAASKVGSEPSRFPFQLSESMKKGLSLLTFPSKRTNSQKKIRKSSRAISSSRITIGEALEKAENARQSISIILKEAREAENVGGSILTDPATQPLPVGSSASVGPKHEGKIKIEIGEETSLTGETSIDTKITDGEKENVRNASEIPVQSEPASLLEDSHNDQHVNLEGSCMQGKREAVASKGKSTATSRLKLSPRMRELLKFTFAHEHFPTSVHMARLAKMMGVQWSQIRNWFTDCRVENKKAGIFPRDKVLVQCPYCDITLDTEVEQKNHLFSILHVRKVLGAEFNGGIGSKPIRWKKLPSSVKAVSKNSGGRVLAVGYSEIVDDNTEPDKVTHTDEAVEELSEADEIESKKLQKRWTDSVLLQSIREQSLQKNASGTSLSNKSFGFQSGSGGNRVQEKEECLTFIKMEAGEEGIVQNTIGSDNKSSTETVETETLPTGDTGASLPTSVKHPIVVGPAELCSNNSDSVKQLQVPSVSKPEVITISDVSINISAYKNKSVQRIGKQMQDNEMAQVSTLQPGPLVQRKGDKYSRFEEVGNNLSNDTNSKVNTLQKREKKCEKFAIKVIKEAKTNAPSIPNINVTHGISSTSNVNVNPVTNQASGSTSLNAELCISRKRCRTTEGTGSYIESQHINTKNTHYLQAPFMTSVLLKSHQNIRNASDETVVIGYQCPTCSKIFQTEWLMIKHCTIHFKYICDICEQPFPSEPMLKLHIHDHLTAAYEDEKYYCQFSCKTCHSLMCECYEPIYCRPKEIPKGYSRPQKARRSKKTFISKPNSGSNDHLVVTLADYKKLVQPMGSLGNIRSGKKKSNATQGNPSGPRIQKLQIRNNLQEMSPPKEFDVKHSKSHGEPKEHDSPKQDTIFLDSSKDVTEVIMHNDLIDVKEEPVDTFSEDLLSIDDEPLGAYRGKRPVSRRRPNKLSSNYIYKDTDFYYMCEMCDASFLSKAELSEHMFFHRLKSRSRRGEKRRALGTADQERQEVLKRLKVEELQSTEVATINVGGFERFKCPMCKGHFASVTDLNRHRTQAHKGFDTDVLHDVNMPVQRTEVFQCAFCEKLYRRERELRRHLKHDCVKIPKHLKAKISLGVTLSQLESMGNGPLYRIIKRNPDDTPVCDPSPSKTSSTVTYKGPITCKYCLMVTRREAEMKRHIWKYCVKIPRDVVKKFKLGATLEELGFLYGSDKPELSEDLLASNNSSPTENNCTSPTENNYLSPTENNCTSPVENNCMSLLENDCPSRNESHNPSSAENNCTSLLENDCPSRNEIYNPSPTEKANSSHSEDYNPPPTLCNVPSTTVNDNPLTTAKKNISSSLVVSQIITIDSPPANRAPSQMFPFPLPGLQFSKSKEPLVCSYCGLWYFRESAILKHMKERCIKIPDMEKEFLNSGSRICSVPQKGNEASEALQLCKAVYKKVEMPEHIARYVSLQVSLPGSQESESLSILPLELNSEKRGSSKELSEPPVVVTIKRVPVAEQITKRQGRGGANRKSTKCRRCHESFKSPEAVLAHSSVHHGPKKGFYRCKLCQFKVPKYKQLREHVWEHTEETPYRCHVCEVKFRVSDALVEHMETEHAYKLVKERNLYKWLPGRNGKYRDIKPMCKDNCEESLEDLDTNLDNLAEVMVITDSDIWTGTNAGNTSADSENVDKIPHETLERVANDSSQPGQFESKYLKNKSSLSKGNISVFSSCENEKCVDRNVETKQSTLYMNNLAHKEGIEEKSKPHHTVKKERVDSGQKMTSLKGKTVNKDATKMKKLILKKDKETKLKLKAIKNCDAEMSSKAKVDNLNAVVKMEETWVGRPVKGNIDTEKGHLSPEGKEIVKLQEKTKEIKKQAIDEACGDDGYAENGEGLLSNVGNLDSVVETVHLTDKCLS